MNLHSFWDSGAMEIQNNSWYMIRPLNQQNLTALKNKANSLVHEFED